MALRHRRSLVLVLLSIFAFLFTGSHSAAQAQRPALTMEWIFGEQASSLAEVPDFHWLADNTAILYDTRQPEAQRTLERLDPASP